MSIFRRERFVSLVGIIITLICVGMVIAKVDVNIGKNGLYVVHYEQVIR